jgi:hypothetical protein
MGKGLYKKWVKEQLTITKTRVRKWEVWNPSETYEAFYETRQVIIPDPICDWSFLVALHEIGHISTGPRLYSHLAEYNAERWAIKRAHSSYGIHSPEYLEDARTYVTNHLLTDIVCFGYDINKVKPYILDWLDLSLARLIALVSEKIEVEDVYMVNLNKLTTKTIQCHERTIQNKY